jgi:hypothetical protein
MYGMSSGVGKEIFSLFYFNKPPLSPLTGGFCGFFIDIFLFSRPVKGGMGWVCLLIMIDFLTSFHQKCQKNVKKPSSNLSSSVYITLFLSCLGE